LPPKKKREIGTIRWPRRLKIIFTKISAIISEVKRGMPALRNVRYEKFCQHIATSPKTGWPQGRCYVEAGFKTADRSADACAARLLTRANIQTRIAELVEPTVRKTRATVDTLAAQFDAVFDGAMGSAQFGAAGSAAAAKSKLLGFMRERLEVGAAGAFDGCQTTEDVLRTLLADQTPAEALASLDVLRGEIERHAVDHAHVVAVDGAWPRAPSESAQALALLRPGRR
jgi:hypothetical protein